MVQTPAVLQKHNHGFISVTRCNGVINLDYRNPSYEGSIGGAMKTNRENDACVWQVFAPPDQRINVTLTGMDRSSLLCKPDYFVLLDGTAFFPFLCVSSILVPCSSWKRFLPWSHHHHRTSLCQWQELNEMIKEVKIVWWWRPDNVALERTFSGATGTIMCGCVVVQNDDNELDVCSSITKNVASFMTPSSTLNFLFGKNFTLPSLVNMSMQLGEATVFCHRNTNYSLFPDICSLTIVNSAVLKIVSFYSVG